jgi:TolA-binding protein
MRHNAETLIKGYDMKTLLLIMYLILQSFAIAEENNLARIADDTRFQNAYYFVTMNMPEKAEVYLAEYVEVYQDGIHRKQALLSLGDINFDKFEYMNAKKYYMQLFTEFPNSEEGVEAYYRSALCYSKMGMNSDAETIFSDIAMNYSQYDAAKKAQLQADISLILSEEVNPEEEIVTSEEMTTPQTEE